MYLRFGKNGIDTRKARIYAGLNKDAQSGRLLGTALGRSVSVGCGAGFVACAAKESGRGYGEKGCRQLFHVYPDYEIGSGDYE